MTQNDRLDSWKAIARHLGRSVRTARRWEEEEALPVHRLMHGAQGSVYAYASELDTWQAARTLGPSRASPSGGASLPADAPPSARPDAVMPMQASIAVLPFAFSGPDDSQRWVAEGLTEEMISGFSRLKRLRVTSRSSSSAIAGNHGSSPAIAEALGVSWLLEGSVLGDGQRLRMSVRLIDGPQDAHVWSEQFACTIDDVFDVQERIARHVVEVLQLRLAADESVDLQRHVTSDVAAWRRLILARQAALRWHPDGLEEARRLVEDALEHSGENAAICATMGRVLLHYREAGIPLSSDPMTEACAWASRASAADPGHPETLITNGWIAYAGADMPSAISQLEEALLHDRDHPDALSLLVNCLLLTGQVARARPIIDHLLAVDPVTPLTRCMPGFADAMEGRFEDALPPYREMLALDPNNPMARLFNVWLLLAADRATDAAQVVAAFPDADGDSIARTISCFLIEAQARGISADSLPAHVSSMAEQSELFARFLAEGCAMARDAGGTAYWLGRSVSLGFANWPYLARFAPSFAALADHPDLVPVLRRARTRWLELAGTPDD